MIESKPRFAIPAPDQKEASRLAFNLIDREFLLDLKKKLFLFKPYKYQKELKVSYPPCPNDLVSFSLT